MKVPVSYGTRLYLLVVAAMVTGLIVVGLGAWRSGLIVVGLAVLTAAAGRLVITERHLGMLQVRSRWFDVAWTALLGVSLVALALLIPPPI